MRTTIIKRFLATLTVAALSVGVFAGPVAASPAADAAVGRFSDLDAQPWAASSIAKMSARGVIKGYDDGTFGSNKPVTRAEAAALVVRLLGKEADAGAFAAPMSSSPADILPFNDLASIAAWERPYVAMAVKDGLMSGVIEDGARVFQAHRAGTRLEVAIILVRALGLEAQARADQTPLTFVDKADIPAWAAGYIAVAVDKGLVTGYPDGTFQPNRPVTRAEMAKMLDNADETLGVNVKLGQIIGPLPPVYSNEVRGTIVTISVGEVGGIIGKAGDEITAHITVDLGSSKETVGIPSNAAIYLNGKATPVADLAEGDRVLIVKNSTGAGVYVRATSDGGRTAQTISGLNVVFTKDKKAYNAGDTAKFTLTMTNKSTAPITLEFNSGNIFDFTVAQDGQTLWQWSHDKLFIMVQVPMTLAPGEVRTYDAEWDMKNNDGLAVDPGTYGVKGWIAGHLQGGTAIPEAPGGFDLQILPADSTGGANQPSTIQGLTVSLATDKTSYAPTDKVAITMTVTNTTDADITIWQGAQAYDFTIKKNGQDLWNWSANRVFPMYIAKKVIAAHQTLTYTEEWDQKDLSGQAAGAGTYTLEGRFLGNLAVGDQTMNSVAGVPAPLTFSIAQP
ncbi:MAG: BsuPI-related putative proteinase inhibitor [Bacillota bacterium]